MSSHSSSGVDGELQCQRVSNCFGACRCARGPRTVPAIRARRQVPHPKESREFASLASIGSTSKAKLWPLGVVRYYIDSENTDVDNPADAPLDADDKRILSAIDHWERMTCIRFTKCASAAACATPYILFVSDA
ncbi:hypothetical protein DIPPA_65659, partial [Diplonema papillatum]